MTATELHSKIEATLASCAEGETPPRSKVDELYTDGCAGVLLLETERLRVKRRLVAAASDSDADAGAAAEAASLSRREAELTAELTALEKLVRSLRTTAEWSRRAGEPEDPA